MKRRKFPDAWCAQMHAREKPVGVAPWVCLARSPRRCLLSGVAGDYFSCWLSLSSSL